MYIIKWGLYVMSALILSGCATTQISAYRDEAFKNSQYSSFIVYTSIKDLAQRKSIENHICELIVDLKATCQKGMKLFPPTRSVSKEQFKATVRQSGADALLTIDLLDAYTRESTVTHENPQTTSDAYGNPGLSTMHYSKSYTAVGKHKITLIDIAKDKSAFVATSETESQMINPSYTLAKKIVEQLRALGLIKGQ